jgi:hypothetical protein
LSGTDALPQGFLENLGKVDVPGFGSFVEPIGNGEGLLDSAVADLVADHLRATLHGGNEGTRLDGEPGGFGWSGDGVAVLSHAIEMERESLASHKEGFLKANSGRYTTGKIGKVNRITAGCDASEVCGIQVDFHLTPPD